MVKNARFVFPLPPSRTHSAAATAAAPPPSLGLAPALSSVHMTDWEAIAS